MVIGIRALATAGSQIKKKLFRKEDKHEKIAVLAEDKLSTISGCISKALNDREITEEKYLLIVSELHKFREMKKEIRAKVKVINSHSDKDFHEQ